MSRTKKRPPKARANSELAVLKSMSQVSAAWCIGKSARWLREQIDRPVDEDGRYNVRTLFAWFATKDRATTRATLTEEELLMAGGDSPWLERWREARARLAQLDLATKEGDLMAVAPMREALSRSAAVMRDFGTRLQRIAARDIFEEYLEMLDRAEEAGAAVFREAKDSARS